MEKEYKSRKYIWKEVIFMIGETRHRVYDFLVDYIKRNGFPPSIREITKAIGLKSTSGVYSHLKKLQEEGLIEIHGNSSRAIKILGYEFVKITEVNKETCNEDVQTEPENSSSEEGDNNNGEKCDQNKESDNTEWKNKIFGNENGYQL